MMVIIQFKHGYPVYYLECQRSGYRTTIFSVLLWWRKNV